MSRLLGWQLLQLLHAHTVAPAQVTLLTLLNAAQTGPNSQKVLNREQGTDVISVLTLHPMF